MRVEGLSKTFRGGVRALVAVTFSVSAGELVALIGGNGAGKSTLLKVLLGLLRPDAGAAYVFGLDPHRDREAVRALAGFAEQDATLDPEMTGRETLHLFYALRGLPYRARRRRLDALVEEYGLASFYRRRVGSYSGGQRQRLHLALETMHAPRLLLLDEPTTSLDPEGRRALWGRLAGWKTAGRTTLVATHDLPEVAVHCDRVLLFQDGCLLAAETPAALIAAHGRARAVVTLAEASGQAASLRRELAGLPGVLDVAVEDRTVTLWRERHPLHGEPALDLLAARGVVYESYMRREPDLPSAYFRLTGSPPVPPQTPPPHRGRAS